jgi:fatty acid desaturase
MNAPKRTRDARNWRDLVTPFEHADARCAWRQVAATLGLLAMGLYCTYRSLALPYWVTLLLALPTAAFLIRTFMLMHDCAHGSLFPSRRANDVLGFFAGVLTLTPYGQWRRDHVLHHASAGDLDRRGHGDVLTLTVREYLARSWWGRVKYRDNMVFEIVCHYEVTQTDAKPACSAFGDHTVIPRVGTHVRITGAFVQDNNHARWNEIHPVSRILVIP